MTTFFYLQLWARAYRDREYYVAVNINNGTEAQNKVLKYSYLPKTMTLSSIATILVEDYLPDAQRKYVFQNFQQSPHCRSYDTIPTYLHGHPRNVILHCLDRKGSSNKFTSEDIEDVNAEQGVFSVHSSKGKVYTVNFGTTSEDKMRNWTCPDWRTHHIPCKHFFCCISA